MTVENDGLPSTETAAHEPDDSDPPRAAGRGARVPDPPTDALPMDAATATRVAAADAAARRAGASDPATHVLPLDHQAEPPAQPDPGTNTHGTMEGDLFDGQGST